MCEKQSKFFVKQCSFKLIKNARGIQVLMKHNAKWPLDERNFADTALWLNAELMKNTAEIGYARFLYGNSMKQK